MISKTQADPPFRTRTNVPKRTRYSVIERLRAGGVIKERSVPDPAVLGRPIVVFAVAEVFADRIAEAAASWRTEVETVHLWVARDKLLGMFFARDATAAESLAARLNPPGVARAVFVMVCDSRRGSIPVFFDYEGEWVRATGLPGTRTYPHSAPSSSASHGDLVPPLARSDEQTLRSMLVRPFAPALSGGHLSNLRRLGGIAREKRLQHDGMVEIRSILDPAACANLWSRFFQSVVIVHGRLLEGKTPEQFFGELLGRGRLAPFLFATDERNVLFCYLSGGGEPPSPPSADSPPPVLSVIRGFLTRVVVNREDLGELATIIDHRYDRPFQSGNRP
ncbi:MAG: Lrp/AsnC family transcriptional regulator [Thermoplasmata archaeon]|nr:Lrp/AsnC family transcriptional regulator [Thermoplasmata archaeon]